jgi:hypothetical protein
MLKAKWTLCCICILCILVGCGRNIPTIEPGLLQSKQSVLLLTPANLPEPVHTLLGQMLTRWRDQQHIAYEWMPSLSALQEEQVAKMKAGSYDVIIVVGSELTKSVAAAAAAMTDKKWILLEDQLASAVTPLEGNHISLRHIPTGLVYQEWDEWVRQQLVTGRMIEWVTTAAHPIPSDWAPSEEAERITLTDATGWFAQLQFQVRSHGPSWIVAYAPLEPAVLQRLKALQVPVINMASTGVELLWESIMADVEQQVVNKAFQPGARAYQPTEMKVLKSS